MFFSTTGEAAAECLGRKGKRALNIPLKRHLLVPTSLGSSPLFARGKTSRGGHYVKSTSCTVTGHQSGQELWGAFTHADDEQSWCSPTTCSYEGHAVPLEGDRDGNTTKHGTLVPPLRKPAKQHPHHQPSSVYSTTLLLLLHEQKTRSSLHRTSSEIP